MFRVCVCVLLAGLFTLSGGLVGQEPKKESPKQSPKQDEPARVKGMLPPNWRKVGLSDNQVQQIYRIQGKYNEEIDKLEAKIREIKAVRDKEMKAVLTADQKKKLDDILLGKDK